MNTPKATWSLTWDYTEWINMFEQSMFSTQRDWNQTLVTRINQLAANIAKASLIGGGNMISLHPHLLPLFDDLEYLKINEDGQRILSGRYRFNLDMTLPEDKIYVYISMELAAPLILEGMENKKMVVVKSDSPSMAIYENNNEFEIINPDLLIGEITILNYD